MFNVIVIGGGPAGVTAAMRARELGASVALVERDRMGGTCTNDGCVPTRVLAKAARLWRDAAQFNEYGLVSGPPELDFEKLMKRTQQLVYTIHEKKQLISHLEQSGVTPYVGVGAAHFFDPHTIELADGRQIQAEKFILCAGGRARRLDFAGAQYALTHSDVWSLKRLPKSLIVVGGAATGCQLASIFEAFGTQVSILEVSPQLLRIEDDIVAQTIETSFRQRGVNLVTGISGIDRIEPIDHGFELFYTRNGEISSIPAEAVILSTGWLGNLDALNLPAAGVETVRNYVQVNDYLQTSTPHIFAAGDITGRMMLVQSAGYEALAAAENAVLGVGNRQQHTIVPHGGFTDPEYGSVGLTEAQARAKEDVVVATVPYADMDRAIIDDHTIGACKLIVSKENHRILGAHVVGEQALEIIHVIAAGMAADIWVEQLAELQIAYPTFTSVIGLAARAIVRDLGVLPLSPQWLALGQGRTAEWERRDV
jgi:pyruvate/2-oxoglutarate dehydrogenase complex dihydrolipoamide dehydrogenase (E3) component